MLSLQGLKAELGTELICSSSASVPLFSRRTYRSETPVRHAISAQSMFGLCVNKAAIHCPF